MGLFRKKRASGKKPIKTYKRVFLPPRKKIPVISSREYRLFKRIERKRLGWYERLARFSERFIRISPDKKTQEDLEKAIAFTDLRITPTSVISLFVMTILFFSICSIVFIVTGLVPLMAGILFAAFGLLLAYYFLKYPINLVKVMRIEASSQVVLAVLYMVISMRISPNLEAALRFAARNISGVLAQDMRKLIWDIEMRKYYSANDALTDYIAKWKFENEEFAEALRLIRDSQVHTPEKARKVLDEALNVILDGTKIRMKHYTQDLKLPVMIIHMMGIVLPVLGTIMAPLAAVFMADLVGPVHFILGYNIILPVIIIWFINNTLRKRPTTLSQVDISKHPDLPKQGKFLIKKKAVPVLLVAVIITLIFISYPVYFFLQNPAILLSGQARHTFFSLAMSIMIILGVSFGLSSYFILSNFQRIRIQNDIQSIESEFELALFQLGNRISGGTPTEVAIEKSIDDIKDLKIADLFRLCLRNIRSLGLTFEGSLFDPTWGALKYYPSRLIRNVMRTVVDTAKRGITYASEGMLRIATYLKNIRETQEYMRDLLEETVSSMKFQAYFLTPIITGLIVSMADIIVKVLLKLGKYLEGIGFGEQLGFVDISSAFGNMETSVSPATFQLIIGVYLIEVIIILAIFLAKISQGENKTAQWYSAGKMLMIGVVIYLLVALSASSIFGDLIAGALSGLGIV